MKGRSVVVQVDPREQRRRRFLLALLAVVLFLGGLAAGGYGGLSLGVESAWENRELRDRVLDQTRELEQLRQWKVDNETRHDIDSTALELVRQELATQQETIAELEKGIQFYRSLMAPDEQTDGLSVRSIDIKPDPDTGKLHFRILVQQRARKHELLTGTLEVKVHGLLEGKETAYNLSDLSDQVPSSEIRLRFKYFQAIDGELELPEGFSPQSVSAAAWSRQPRRAKVNKEFPWSIQEKVSHVGH
jgi:hypothetical protein